MPSDNVAAAVVQNGPQQFAGTEGGGVKRVQLMACQPGIPLATAISMTAVPLGSIRKRALLLSPTGPVTSTS